MKQRVFGVNVVVALMCCAQGLTAQSTPPASQNGQPTAKATLEQQYSYAIGLDMASRFRSTQVPLDVESLVAGIQTVLSDGKPRYDQATCTQAMQQLQTIMRDKAMAQQKVAGTKNRQLGSAFLAENKKKAGIQVTQSGLQYRVVQPGTGATPTKDDTVRCNYRGTLIDGTEFDASNGKPIEFPVQGVISGWTEALQLMKVGAKWQLFIPADLAYKDEQRGPLITPGSTLVFDIELLGISGK